MICLLTPDKIHNNDVPGTNRALKGLGKNKFYILLAFLSVFFVAT